MGPPSLLHQHFADLADDSQDDQHQQQHQHPDGSASMSAHLDAALGQLACAQKSEQVQRGTLADAWKKQLQHEDSLELFTEAGLLSRVGNVPQASSNDPELILDILASWRRKVLKAQAAQESRSVVEGHKAKTEAIRAKARLLYLRGNTARWGTATRVSQGALWCVRWLAHAWGCQHSGSSVGATAGCAAGRRCACTCPSAATAGVHTWWAASRMSTTHCW